MAVAKLAEFVATAAALGGGGGAPAVVAPDQEVPGGDLPLTPIQRWFFSEAFPAPNHYNQSTMLTIAPGVQPDVVKVGSSCSAAHVQKNFTPQRPHTIDINTCNRPRCWR